MNSEVDALSGPAPKKGSVIWRCVGVFVAFAILSHIFSPYPTGDLNVPNPSLKLAVYFLAGYMGLFIIFFVPIALLPAFLFRKAVGFWKVLNGMLFILAIVLGVFIYGGYYADCQNGHRVLLCQ